MKHKACSEVGIRSKNLQLPSNIKEDELIKLLDQLNSDVRIHGILIQLPLPLSIDSYKLVDKISPEKDVDGLHPYNMGKLLYRKYDLIPCTPRGIMTLLSYYDVSISSSHAVIINRSPLVGKPLMLLTKFDPSQMHLFNTDMLLLNKDAIVSICHSKTKDLLYFTKNADILISAVGRRPEFKITADMIKSKSTIIDVGVNKIKNKTIGDIDFKMVKEKAGYITPNPGGVGPMTVAMLLYNTIIATSLQTGFKIEEDVDSYLKIIKESKKP
jgi:methylenetetrahydrofolate dehydrogenase (NADP+)/methenyltetrahydrofolate cyclohydrolase